MVPVVSCPDNPITETDMSGSPSPVQVSFMNPGTIEFLPLQGMEHFGCQVYQVKIAGTEGVLGDIWDINHDTSTYLSDNTDILSDEEWCRAERIIPPGARNNFIARHVILRKIISSYLLIPPEKICFSYNPWGRPSIEGNTESGRIFLNISHTEGRILIAVSRHFQPGIDCEKVCSGTQIMGIAHTYFNQDVADYLASLMPSERRHQFFRIWVHTEAVMKAIGTGLGQSPRTLSFPPGLPIPSQYMFASPDHPHTGILLATDLPSEDTFSAACAFHLR
jgi:4'-phosphopantetheinyl transferase